MSDKIPGVYTLKKSDNFDAFLKELGMGLLKRGAAAAASATITVTNDGDTYTINTNSTFSKSEIKFKIGEEFDESRQDGAKVKSTVTVDGNKMTHVQKCEGKPDVVITREFTDEGMNTTATTNNVTTTRYYARQ